MVRTLKAQLPLLTRVRFLVDGKTRDTLAGHLDLTQTFMVNSHGLGEVAAPTSPVTVITAPINNVVEKLKNAVR